MKYKVLDIIDFMNNWAKLEYQESWDNSGVQINLNGETNSVTIALDLTDKVIDMAIKNDSKLIITHHPMFFSGLKSIDENTYIGKIIIKAIKNNISIYSAHTSLDIAENGVNDVLCEVIGLNEIEGLSMADSGYMIGKVGYLEKEKLLKDIYLELSEKLNYSNIRIYGDIKNNIKKIAVCGGSGSSMIDDAIKKDVDLYITGDIKHHDAQYAYENNITLMDISHFNGEKLVLNKVASELSKNFEIVTNIIDTNDFEVKVENM